MLQFLVGSSSDQIEGLLWLMILIKELLNLISKRWIMNTMTTNREVLPPDSWKNRLTDLLNCVDWIQWPGTSDPPCFHLNRHPVHIIDCPRLETQPYHLPWTNPDCTGAGWSSGTPAIHWWHHHGQQNRRFFKKGKKIVQIFLKAAFAIKQNLNGPYRR